MKGSGKHILVKLLFSLTLAGLVFTTAFTQKEKDFRTYDFEGLEQRFRNGNDTLYVVNFWATWCKPCVEELPYLEAFHEKYKSDKVKVLLVSLDFKKHVDSKLIPFLEKHKLKAEVVHLDDPKAHIWIDLVDPSWSGAIPATIARKGKNENFHEGSFPDMKSIEAFVNVLL